PAIRRQSAAIDAPQQAWRPPRRAGASYALLWLYAAARHLDQPVLPEARRRRVPAAPDQLPDVEVDFVGRDVRIGHLAEADAVGRQAHLQQRLHDLLGAGTGGPRILGRSVPGRA